MSDAVAALHETAPAKVNLTLHVTGRRGDGYHLLDSLVVFTEVGDRLEASPAADISLTVTGPEGGGLSATDNLVARAAAMLRESAGDRGLGARLRLDKRLPVASGIGGGSADAAAALRLLTRLWRLDTNERKLAAIALALGADVPVCMHGRVAHMSGIGERILPLGQLPELPLVLVNPAVAVSTAAVFARLERRDNAAMPDLPGSFASTVELADFLARCRNDLEAPAVQEAPIVAAALAALAARPGCLLARMSGSGATCFGIFARTEDADAAATALKSAHSGWWTVSTRGH